MTSVAAAPLKNLVVEVILALSDREPWQYAIDLDESNPNSLASLFGYPNESLQEIFVLAGLMKNRSASLFRL
jgi:hypothetical protein